MRILVTGVAGFIGYHVTTRLLERGDEVVGVDNLNDYYDVALKRSRLARLKGHFDFEHIGIEQRERIASLFASNDFSAVVHLAAQAGVRYSLDNPYAYADSNLVGFVNVLEGCRHSGVQHLVFASSSSVYGGNTRLPFRVTDSVDHPVSLYAATKKSNELLAHSYAHLYGLPTTGLRFFTVYGPWGRPDMAYYRFTEAILKGRPIQIFNQGSMSRDFTYIDDIAEGVVRVLDRPARRNTEWNSDQPEPSSSWAPYRIYNIGNNQPVSLLDFIEVIEKATGCQSIREMLPMQPGDVRDTCADVDALSREFGFEPSTPLETGIGRFVDWYRDYHGLRTT